MKRRNMIRLGMGKEGMKAVEMGPGKVAWIIGYGSPPRSKVSQAISAKPVWMMLATFRFWALFYPFMFCGCLCWLLLPGKHQAGVKWPGNRDKGKRHRLGCSKKARKAIVFQGPGTKSYECLDGNVSLMCACVSVYVRAIIFRPLDPCYSGAADLLDFISLV